MKIHNVCTITKKQYYKKTKASNYNKYPLIYMKEKSLKIKYNFDKCYINQIFGEFAINYKYVSAIITLLNYTNKNSDKILCYLTMYKVSKNLRILSSYTIK